MARGLLYLSLIANVALVSYLLLQGVVPGDARSDVRTDEIPSLITRQAEQGSYQYYRDAGLSDAEAKGLVLQHLRHRYVDAVPLPEDRFWEQRPLEAQSGYRLHLLEAHAQLRSALRLQFGEAAQTEPVFATLFQPMAVHAPYLAPQEQLALQRFQAERPLQLATTMAQALAGANAKNTVPAMPAEPSSVLSEAAWREYRLRSSPLAERLRNSGVAFTETSFRAAYEILSEDFPVQQPLYPYQLTAQRHRLVDLLGESAALQLWSQVDVGFSALVLAGQQQGLRDTEILAAYDIISDTEQAIFDAQHPRDHDRQSAMGLINQALAQQRDQLVRLIGESGADVLQAARSRPLAQSAVIETTIQ